MSYCQLKGFKEDETVALGEYQNAHGFLAYVWTALFDKYIPKRFEYDSWRSGEGSRLCNLVEDERLTTIEKKMLEMTFDNALVRIEQLRSVIVVFEEFFKMYPPGDYVCHVPAIVETLKELLTSPGDILAIGWYGMSVCEELWSTYDSETDEEHSYALSIGDKHWFVNVELKDECDD
jgi:hypothetical protein